MSFPKSGRIQRRLLQIAALSLAGLMSGLLSGCSSESISQISLLLPNHHNADWQAYSTTSPAPLPSDHLSSHANFTTSRRYLDTPTQLYPRATQRRSW